MSASPLARVRLRVEAEDEPASEWKVAVPAVLVKVVLGDQDCGPDWVKVAALVTGAEDWRNPALVKVPLLVMFPLEKRN